LSVVRYDATFAFVGFYICRPRLRGRGLGRELFEAGLARVEAATLGLDGVLEQEANYARDGFVTAHHSVRYGGTLDLTSTGGDDLRALGIGDLDALVTFERAHQVFPAPRPAFLARWLTAPGSTALAVGDGNRIEGYGVARACREGHKIGPLFCPDRTAAERLLLALVAHVDDGPIFLDVPTPNVDGTALARDLGLEPVFETARMYRGPAPELYLDRVFGVTTFELG
ncbi:MAG TPA: GNAT family N-acetyltransferase, partial [Acidimicrobiia bacterium]